MTRPPEWKCRITRSVDAPGALAQIDGTPPASTFSNVAPSGIASSARKSSKIRRKSSIPRSGALHAASRSWLALKTSAAWGLGIQYAAGFGLSAHIFLIFGMTFSPNRRALLFAVSNGMPP